ncbi:hypothetical protein LCGC14_1600030 [marine sediment metagenome]|uniref:Cytidyltransferase-like domain-containing protein n=1 Tax=marine sediment metagenome TaxID=412755 RepID=A0A0F9IXX0_9ZZZZ
MKMVLVSGGFDPLHDGHLDLLEGAAQYGSVIVALTSDAWLVRKKGYAFLPWLVRARILRALEPVHDVINFNDGDNSTCSALLKVLPQIFANGGDRTEADSREHEVCHKFGIKELFDVGGPKKVSSQGLVNDAIFECTGLRP